MPEEHGASLGTVLKFTKWKLKGQQLEGYEIRFVDLEPASKTAYRSCHSQT